MFAAIKEGAAGHTRSHAVHSHLGAELGPSGWLWGALAACLTVGVLLLQGAAAAAGADQADGGREGAAE